MRSFKALYDPIFAHIGLEPINLPRAKHNQTEHVWGDSFWDPMVCFGCKLPNPRLNVSGAGLVNQTLSEKLYGR
jgi:hypothetical protein